MEHIRWIQAGREYAGHDESETFEVQASSVAGPFLKEVYWCGAQSSSAVIDDEERDGCSPMV